MFTPEWSGMGKTPVTHNLDCEKNIGLVASLEKKRPLSLEPTNPENLRMPATQGKLCEHEPGGLSTEMRSLSEEMFGPPACVKAESLRDRLTLKFISSVRYPLQA